MAKQVLRQHKVWSVATVLFVTSSLVIARGVYPERSLGRLGIYPVLAGLLSLARPQHKIFPNLAAITLLHHYLRSLPLKSLKVFPS